MSDYALTLLQPWAWAVMHAGKTVENRTWVPPAALVGQRFWVHSSKGGSVRAIEHVLEGLVKEALISTAPSVRDLPRGAIVGSVRLVDVIQYRSARADALVGNPWYAGATAFILEDPKPLAQVVLATGMRKFWRVPPDVLTILHALEATP
jgi:hypothetical protein